MVEHGLLQKRAILVGALLVVTGCPRSEPVRARAEAKDGGSAVSAGAAGAAGAADAADALEGVAVPEGMSRAELERCKVREIKCSSSSATDGGACRPETEISWKEPIPAWGTIPYSPRVTARARATDPHACCYVDFYCPSRGAP